MGYATCRNCNGSGRFYDRKSGKTFDCRACNGSGSNKNLWTTDCRRCGHQITYKAGTDTPKFCKDCRNIELTKTCAQVGCHNIIKYKVGWDNVSDYCGSCRNKREKGYRTSTCKGSFCSNLVWSPPGKNFDFCFECSQKKKKADEAKWKEKPCAGGCRNTIRYNTDWEHIPNFCKTCKEKQKQQRSTSQERIAWPSDKALPASDRSLNNLRSQGVTGVSVKHNNRGGYHVTIFSKEERYSYDTDSSGSFIQKSAHHTDQAAKLLGKDTIGQNPTNKNRW